MAILFLEFGEDQGVPSGGGRLASRLIQDWFAGILQLDDHNGPPTECPTLRVFPPFPNAGSDHDLLFIPSQSYDEAHDPEMRGRTLVSCMCRYCRYHFIFRVTPGSHEANTAHLQHHLLEQNFEWYDVDSSTVYGEESRKLYPLKGRLGYLCSLCNMTVELEITLPRLKPDWIQLIMDERRIKETLRIAKEEDPTRYGDLTPEKERAYMTGALSTLNTYLRNVLDDDGTGPQKRIAVRNKTFFVQFGRSCEPIFQYLGFKQQYDDETRDTYWIPPRLTPQEGKTALGSPRAFYEDVRSEVQSVLDDRPPLDGQRVVRPLFSARDQLEKALGCDKVPESASPLPVDNSEAQHFRTLGAPVNADDAMLKFAYRRQTEINAEHIPLYLGALGNIARRRGEELQMFVFTEQELLEKKHRSTNASVSPADPIEKAFAHFGLSKDRREPASFFIGVYRNYREQAPAQKSAHRQALGMIATYLDNQEIKDEVFRKNMELSEACQYLGVEDSWPLDSIAATAQSLVSAEQDPEIDPELVLLALETIAASRPMDDPNREAFSRMVTELQSSRKSSPADLPHSPSPGNGDVDLPVGLANLRNTCYLNSILQYFYSVNAVRNLALNTDLAPLEPTEPNLSNLLRGNDGDSSSQKEPSLETGRAFVGHEFTRELGTLFKELDECGTKSISPRQRLANAALLRPEKLRPKSSGAKPAEVSSNTDAPPLPPRAGEGSNPKIPFAPMVEAEQSDTDSPDSAQTLVNPADEEVSLITQEKDNAAPKDSHEEQAPANTADDHPRDGGTKTSKLSVEELAAELDKPNVGSDQMDVDEVMGNAIDHLRAAFKVAHIGSDDVRDPIEWAFFSTFIDNRKKIGETEWNRTKRLDRWVTAYPAQSGPRDLYDALENSFDLERLPGDLLSFTTIQTPAPHFHICIQRSDGVRKNTNPITIPETLYLDRFMDSGDHDSPLSKARKRRWDIKTRLNELTQAVAGEAPGTAKVDARVAEGPSKSTAQDDFSINEVDDFLVIGHLDAPGGDSSPAATSNVNAGLAADKMELDPAIEALLGKYGVDKPENIEASAMPPPQPSADRSLQLTPSELDEFWTKFGKEEADERDRLIAERAELFSGSQQVAYRLHAVVCHAGSSASAGHYWVWIHDFEQDVWRKYNDTTVSVHPADFVFEQLNTKGEPYYLAYVRAEDVHNLVSIPRRRQQVPPAAPPPEQQQQQQQEQPQGSVEDVVMVDGGDRTAALAHIEPLPAYSAN